MAKILTTLPVSSITGRLAGTTFQRTGSGLCAQTLALPPRRASARQYNARRAMATLGGVWRSLTQTERDSWVQHAPPTLDPYAYFQQLNLTAVYRGNPINRTYQPPDIAVTLTNITAVIDNYPDPELLQFYMTASVSEDIENYPWNQRTFIDVPSSTGQRPVRSNATSPTDSDYGVSGTDYEFFVDPSQTPLEPQWLPGVTVGVWIQLYSESTGHNLTPEVYAQAIVPS